jgi:hypothetical protein
MGSRAYPISYVQTRRRAVGGSAITFTEDFPVLPISHALITLDCQQTSANTNDSLVSLLGGLSNISFLFRSTQIWSLSGVNLARLAMAATNWLPIVWTVGQGASARKIVTLLLPFGRTLFNTFECFPATVRGECQVTLSFTGTSGNYQTYLYTLEFVQLPDAAPGQFLRATQMTVTPAASGDMDIDLPRGAPLAGLGTVVTNSEPGSATADIESVKILMANQDTWYSSSFFNSQRALSALPYGVNTVLQFHSHIENTAGAYAQNATTLTQFSINDLAKEFGYMVFDPTNDGKFILDGTKALDLKARITFNAANQCQLLPLELWSPAIIGKPVGKG